MNVSRPPAPASQIRGNGCVAADLNGDGFTDLYVTSAVDDELLWNNGDGTFTEGARADGIVSFGWHSGAAVADVNGDGRPDLFVSGYTEHERADGRLRRRASRRTTRACATSSSSTRATGDGHARFRDVSVAAGLRASALRPQPRRRLHRLRRRRPPRSLRRQRRGSEPPVHERRLAGGAKADPKGLGFRLVDRARRRGRRRRRTPAWASRPPTTTATARTDLFVSNSRGQTHAVFRERPGAASKVPRVREQPPGLRDRASARNFTRLGRLLGRPQQRRPPRSRARQRRDPGHESRAGRRARSRRSRTSRARACPASSRTRAGSSTSTRLPKIIGRGLAAADFDNDGHVDIAVNSIGGPLVLLENHDTPGNWLEVSLEGFHPGAIVTAELPGGRTLVARGARRQQLPLVRGSARCTSASATRRRCGRWSSATRAAPSRASRASRPTRS